MPRFLSVCLNPTFQRTLSISHLHRGEVSRARTAQLDIAGKGVNTTRVLSQLGASVRHLTHLGQGKEVLLDLCGREGLEIVWAPSSSPIRTCITLLDDETRSTTEIVEPTESVDENTVRTIRDLYSKELEIADWVILSGTKAPGYPADLFAEFSDMAVRQGRTVAVDYRGPELLASLDAGISVVKINLVEFVTTFLPGMRVSEGNDSDVLQQAMEKMRELSKRGCDYVITRGGRDVLFSRNGSIGTLIPPSIVPVNSIGSGDAFCAGLCFRLSGGSSLEDAVAEGARCGAVNAALLKPGTLK
jgi:1-phosphofructokinase/tagatose 6-phosphate kinase